MQLGFDVQDNGQQLVQGLLLVACHIAIQVLDLLPGACLNLRLHVTLGTQNLHTEIQKISHLSVSLSINQSIYPETLCDLVHSMSFLWSQGCVHIGSHSLTHYCC